jgi:hypothetical protein
MPESDGRNKTLQAHALGPARTQAENVATTPDRPAAPPPAPAQEFGGPKGPEPTRYGDWQRNGRCTDF